MLLCGGPIALQAFFGRVCTARGFSCSTVLLALCHFLSPFSRGVYMFGGVDRSYWRHQGLVE